MLASRRNTLRVAYGHLCKVCHCRGSTDRSRRCWATRGTRRPILPDLSGWVFATAEGIGSARQLARLCEEHDAYRWLRGGVPINYHMLADFRVAHQQEMDDLLTNILASMMAEDLVTLRHVAQDGMRTRAGGPFRPEASGQGQPRSVAGKPSMSVW